MTYTIGGCLYHHGILGMKWGNRQGPPYPLSPGEHSASERKAGYKKSIGGGRNEEVYERNRKKKSVEKANSSDKKSGLTDEQKRKLKKGIKIAAISLAAIGGTYLAAKGAVRLRNVAKATINERVFAEANTYFREYANQASKADSLWSAATRSTLDLHNREASDRFAGMAEKATDNMWSLRNLGNRAKSEASDRMRNMKTKEKVKILKEAISDKINKKGTSSGESTAKEVINSFINGKDKSEVMDLFDKAKLKNDKDSMAVFGAIAKYMDNGFSINEAIDKIMRGR